MTVNPLRRLGELGQSPWYDFITRDLVQSGELARLIREDGLRGMTTNPTIFEKSVAGSDLYDEDIRRLSAEGRSPAEIFEALAVEDVRAACDLFLPLYQSCGGSDGLVSIEVSPALAHDTAGTIAEAGRLWRTVNRPNVMIKIPGTRAGLPAITQCISDGVSVNVTLLFSVERYQDVAEAFLLGLERRVERGLPIDRVASVASFFVSRVDAKIDPWLDQLAASGRETPEIASLRGRAAIANASMAYAAFERLGERSRWQRLSALGAMAQRPLWASTSTKDPRYPDVYYVEALIAPRTVNTLPPETFAAFRHHGTPAVRILRGPEAESQLAALRRAGVDLPRVASQLEDEGVAKFAASYESLLKVIDAKAGTLAESR